MQMIQDLTVRSSAVTRNSVRVAALAVLAGAATLSLQAQNMAATDEPGSNVSMASVAPVLDLSSASTLGYPSSSYSSSVGATESSSAENFIPSMSDNVAATSLDEMQPPPRRRYGRPRYNDSSHNSDGSNKYAFVAGAGASVPVGNFHRYNTPSWSFQVGGGRNFNKKFGVLLQFDYDHFGLQGSTLANQEYIYNYGVPTVDQISGLDGNSHIWSFTLDPKYTFYDGNTTGAYVVVGGGFYHKVTNFQLPALEDTFYGQYEVLETVDHYSANMAGVNAGFGLTYKLSKFANERVYLEGRYVYVPFSGRTGYTAANVATTLYSGDNAYPANSHHTSYIPITVGLRF